MALTGEKDQHGNLYDSRGFWIGVGENEGEVYYAGQWFPIGSGTGKQITSQPEPKAAPSGGGGSAPISYADPYYDENLRAWVQRDSRGNISILSRDDGGGTSGVPDANGDGYDDKTGLPSVGGVSATRIGDGIYFQGKRINPDGSPYVEGPGKASTWTGYGPQGQGTYYLDGPNGTPGTYIGRTTAGSSGTNSVNVSSGSGLTAAEQLAIANARAKGDVLSARAKADADIQVQREQAQLQKDLLAEKARLDQEGDLLAQAWQKDPTNPANIERERNYALRIQEFNASLRERQQDRKLRAAEGMPAALRAYDAKAYFDALESAGFDVNNLLASGTNLLTQNALLPAATLQAILNEPDAVASTGLPVPGSTAGGAPSTPPPPGGAPPTPPPSGPSQALQDAERAHTAALSGLRNATWQANQPQKGSDRMIDLGRAQEGQWANSLLTGIQPLSFDVLGQARGGTQSIDFTLPNYVDPSAPKAIDYGNDNIQREQGPVNPVLTTGMEAPIGPDGKPVPGLNSGGVANAGLAVVGEGGGRKPLGSSELLIDPTQDAQVVPITGRQAQQYLSSGIPGYNTGTVNDYGEVVNLAVSRPRRTAPMAPVATAPSPIQPPATGTKPPNPTQPPQAVTTTSPTQAPAPVGGSIAPKPTTNPTPTSMSTTTATPTQPTAAAGLPPPNQAVLDEIQRKRTETVLMGGPDPNDIQWQIRSPLYQQTWAQNRAQATGIPEEEFLWQGARNRLGVGGVAQSGLRPMRY